jgi:fibronectin-binding autotransporter adhesin
VQLGSGVALTNSGTFALGGGLVSGAGTLTNSGGSITGPGVISAAFNNASGVVLLGGATTLTIVKPWTNSGIIQLTSPTSNLTGGAITNFGVIQGLGTISNSVSNSGSIEANGGTLTLAGATTNSAAGTLSIDAGSKLIVTTGLATNAGTIVNQGGAFDNNGFALNNTGVVAGFGVFRTGGSGLTNNGGISLTGGATTVIGPVTNQNGRMITVAYNPALFTGLVTNNGSATFNILSTTATFAGGFTNGGNSSFSKAGSGEVDITAAPTLDDNSVLSVAAGTMKFNVVSGTPSVGAGVTAVVASGATLELSGTVAALSIGPNRADISDNSSAPGIIVTGTKQQVGGVDGSGATQVNAGSDLTADHIVQSALIIGGQNGSPGTVTIAASDSLGRPMVQDQSQPVELASASALALAGPIQADLAVQAPISSLDDSPTESDLTHPGAVTDVPIASLPSTAVPEPSTLVLVLLGAVVVAIQKARVPGRRVALASEA